MIGILMVDRNWALDSNGVQPIHLKYDLQRFNTITSNRYLVMGRKTYEQLPKSVLDTNNRRGIVMSRTENYFAMNDHAMVIHGASDMLSVQMVLTKHDAVTDFVAIGGGSSILELLSHGFIHAMYITKVDTEFENPTSFMKNLDKDPFSHKLPYPYAKNIADIDRTTGDVYQTEFCCYMLR